MILQRKTLAFVGLTILVFLFPQKTILGDYLVTLKSGRKITVYSYKAEGSRTRLYTPEGEIVLSKEHIIEIKVTEAISAPPPQKKRDEEPPLPQPAKSPLFFPEEKPSEVPEQGPQGKK